MTYEEFVKAKALSATTGYEKLGCFDVNPILKPHQAAIVRWMVEGGRRACFAAFGLGKTMIQLETVRITRQRAGGRGLIIMPLGVRNEFFHDAAMLGLTVKFIRRIEEATDPDGIYLTNYESIRDGKIDPLCFTVCSLDEAACLRGFGGTKTFREFMKLLAGDDRSGVITDGVKYRFVATATPSPNEYIELLCYAAYLGIMDVSQAKTRFFKRDSTKADKLTIHPHKEREFWLWVASWGVFLQKPSDLGFSDEGYEMPPLNIHWHEVTTDHSTAGFEKWGQARLLANSAIGVQEAAREKRGNVVNRLAKLREIVLSCQEKITIGGHDGKEDRIQCGLPRETQREDYGSLSGVVRKEQGQNRQGSAKEIPSRIPQDSPSQKTITGTTGCVQQDPPREISERPRIPCTAEDVDERTRKPSFGRPESVPSKRIVRDNDGGVQHNTSGARRKVCDLRECGVREQENSIPFCGSQPCDGKDQGPSLQPLQLRDRSFSGQSGAITDCVPVFEPFVIWCQLNDEQKAVDSLLKEMNISFSSLYGNDNIEHRDDLMSEWKAGKTTAFVSKASMYGAGANLQRSHIMIFAGIGFKFYEFLQGIHRQLRYLQTHECTVHLIYSEAEMEIKKTLERKWEQHNKQVKIMSEIIREYGLSAESLTKALSRSVGVERIEVSGEHYRIVNNDCVVETRSMEESSVGLILTSIPFSTQYEYSPNYADFGHTNNNEHFFEQMDFLTPELLRVLKPGRLAAIHVKDRIVPGGLTGLGFQTVYPFHAKCIDHYTRHGFAYMGMKTIVTDVVRENNQTYRLGWTEQCKDGTKMGVGMPEYLLIFRRPPTDTANSYADEPVVKRQPDCLTEDGQMVPYYRGGKALPGADGYSRSRWQIDAHGFTRSSGDRLLDPEELKTLKHDQIFKIFRDYSLTSVYNFEHHVKIGEMIDSRGMLPVTFMLLQPQSWSPDVWTDITRMLTLNGAQSAKGKEMHLCALQLDICNRVIDQFSMPGEVVYDPFAGIGSVPYCAVRLGRVGWGTELNSGYFFDAAGYCKAAEREMEMPSLFDIAGVVNQ